jgi:hypothetical protein
MKNNNTARINLCRSLGQRLLCQGTPINDLVQKLERFIGNSPFAAGSPLAINLYQSLNEMNR